jgi:glycosyltransferase involved in cell wall biosynthesis
MKITKLQQRILEIAQIDYPKIDPVPERINRPFWSVMIPTYNRTQYLGETLRSILEQDPGSEDMQIEVIDNCSTEGEAEAIVKEIGKGRVDFYRQPYNVGMAGNWNTCINRARGHWVHILHDDDTVRPGFYSRLREALEREPSVGAAFCRHIYMDGEGHWQHLSLLENRTSGILPYWLERFAVGLSVQCPSIIVRRSVYEKLGGFCLELKYMPDCEMWKRIAAHYPFWYEPQPLACYRSQHSYSETSSLFQSGIVIADGYKVIEISRSYLPEAITTKTISKAKDRIRIFSFVIIRHNIAIGKLKAAMVQMQEVFKYDSSWRVIKGIVRSLMLIGERELNQILLRVVGFVKKIF